MRCCYTPMDDTCISETPDPNLSAWSQQGGIKFSLTLHGSNPDLLFLWIFLYIIQWIYFIYCR